MMALRPTTVGILWMSASELVFLLAWCSIKVLGRHLPLFEIVFFRAAVSLVLLIPVMKWSGSPFRGRALGTLFLRALFGFLAMIASFYAMIHLKIGNASTLIGTMPIFVALLAPIFLREPFQMKQLGFVLVSFVGIGMLVKPDAEVLEVAALFGLASAVFAALAMLCLRKLHASDSAMTITFSFTALSTIASAPLGLAHPLAPTPAEWGLIALVGVSGTVAQLFLARAYKFGPAATIAPFAYVSVVGSFAAGVVVFGEIPDLWSVLGAAIVIACGVGISLLAPEVQQETAQASRCG